MSQMFIHNLVSEKCTVHVVHALSDNFMYLITDVENKVAGVIDPVEPQKIVDVAKELGIEITCVLTTHSHWDHHGGNKAIMEMIPNLKVYGGIGDGVDCCTDEVGDDSAFKIGDLDVRVLFTPCHTPGPPAVFTGDSLFVCGCGNFNMGTPREMRDAFLKIVENTTPETLVYVGHEYTVSNLKYASFVEPKNEMITAKLAWAKEHTAAGGITVPSTMEEETLTNPFMKATQCVPCVMEHAGTTDGVQAMKFVREEKSGGGWKSMVGGL